MAIPGIGDIGAHFSCSLNGQGMIAGFTRMSVGIIGRDPLVSEPG